MPRRLHYWQILLGEYNISFTRILSNVERDIYGRVRTSNSVEEIENPMGN